MEPESWICNKNEFLLRVKLVEMFGKDGDLKNHKKVKKIASGRDHIKKMAASSHPEQMIDVLL